MKSIATGHEGINKSRRNGNLQSRKAKLVVKPRGKRTLRQQSRDAFFARTISELRMN